MNPWRWFVGWYKNADQWEEARQWNEEQRELLAGAWHRGFADGETASFPTCGWFPPAPVDGETREYMRGYWWGRCKHTYEKQLKQLEEGV